MFNVKNKNNVFEKQNKIIENYNLQSYIYFLFND